MFSIIVLSVRFVSFFFFFGSLFTLHNCFTIVQVQVSGATLIIYIFFKKKNFVPLFFVPKVLHHFHFSSSGITLPIFSVLYIHKNFFLLLNIHYSYSSGTFLLFSVGLVHTGNSMATQNKSLKILHVL